MRKPLEDKIEVVPDPPKEKTDGGVLIPGIVHETTQEGTVKSVGEGIPDYPMILKPGYRVLYSNGVGNAIEVNGEKILIMRQSDVLEYDDLTTE